MPRPDDLPPLDLPGGYQARRFLGRGAFGEVYEAEAPGRVAVAVKIIPRTLKAKEAKREEEALEIIRSLRHPFLLSLQAFYSLPDRLVIVLELAEGSLSRDRKRVSARVSRGFRGTSCCRTSAKRPRRSITCTRRMCSTATSSRTTCC